MVNARTFSSYTNAYAIFVGARKLGVSVSTTDLQPTFPIPTAIRESSSEDWLLFTEEASLMKALKKEIAGKFWPKVFPTELLDDKWALAEWLKLHHGIVKGLKQWSLSEVDNLTYPCLLKAKHSWLGNVKLPRGWICNSQDDVKHHLGELCKYNNWQDIFFFQEWLGNMDCRVVSVCGFHDTGRPERNLTALVERIYAHNDGLSCSAAVQTIKDEWGVVGKTAAILNLLKFVGPYEMEYLLVKNQLKVLELNPRFWMQHAIFFYNQNGLIKRYLNMDLPPDYQLKLVENIIWIDTLHLVFSLMCLKFEFLYFVIRKYREQGFKIILWPSIPQGIRVCISILWRKIYQRFFLQN